MMMVSMMMMLMMITLLLIVAPRAVWERVERPLVEGTVRWRAAPSHSHVLHHDDKRTMLTMMVTTAMMIRRSKSLLNTCHTQSHTHTQPQVTHMSSTMMLRIVIRWLFDHPNRMMVMMMIRSKPLTYPAGWWSEIILWWGWEWQWWVQIESDLDLY